MSTVPRKTVSEVLECLKDEFENFGSAFTRGKYVLWLGSGLSRGVVPGVPELLEQLLEAMRVKIETGNQNCRFQAALEEILIVAGVPDDTRSKVDFGEPLSAWHARKDIVERMVDKYSAVLDVQVAEEDKDYLVWTGLDVPTTYGAPTLEPDVEHLCVAVLMLEGMVQSAPTTNWDGLVEKALERLSGSANDFLRVIVVADDFRNDERQGDLIKFHGCAVRALENEPEYRPRLIARKSQISGWTTKVQNQMMKQRLEYLFSSNPALFIGLSAQDANIHTIFSQATVNLEREWPTEPPAVVFAEEGLHQHHTHVLRTAYGDDAYAENVGPMSGTALLGAYAKPVLLALVLLSLSEKMCSLTEDVTELILPPEDLLRIKGDICGLRDAVAAGCDGDCRAMIEAIIAGTRLILTVFRTGAVAAGSDSYQPISTSPIIESRRGPDFPARVLGRLAVVFSLLSRGLREERWALTLGDESQVHGGVIRLERSTTTKMFLLKDARVWSDLELAGSIDPNDDDALVVLAESSRSATRSPHATYGRTGRSRVRHIDLEEICASVGTADELFEAFTLQGAI